jgi:hypothetical protein
MSDGFDQLMVNHERRSQCLRAGDHDVLGRHRSSSPKSPVLMTKA